MKKHKKIKRAAFQRVLNTITLLKQNKTFRTINL